MATDMTTIPKLTRSLKNPSLPMTTVIWFSAKLDDEVRCLLTGVTYSQDMIVLADNENKRIKRFSLKEELVDFLDLGDPCGLCTLPKSTDVAVTEADLNQITFVNMAGAMHVTSAVKTRKKYEPIAALDEVKLVVGCCQLGESSVDVIDCGGSVLKTIQTNKEGQRLFRNPAAITVTCAREILVSDAGKCELMCISQEGELGFTFDPKGRPSGICSDISAGCIYMAQYDSHSVFKLTADGNKQSVIVDKAIDLKYPLALAMCKTHLILTEELPSDRVFLIQLSPRPVMKSATAASLSNVQIWFNQSPRSTDSDDIDML